MRIIFLVCLVGAASFAQAWGIRIWNVIPNLALVSLASASFFTAGIWENLLLILWADFFLKPDQFFGKEVLIFTVVAAVLVLLKKKLPGRPLLNNLTLIGAGTLIFYGLSLRDLILTPIFFKELGVNLIFGVLIFAILRFLWQDNS